MDQLTSSLLALNVDGQQRLPFQPRSALNAPFNLPIKNVVAQEFIPTYPVKNNEHFSLAPMTFRVPSNYKSATASANQQMDLEEDEEMLPSVAAAAAAPAKLQTPIRRSDRLAKKPRFNYTELSIIE